MDVVTFGEVMTVFNPAKMGPLNYVHEFRKGIGGAEGNVALGLSKLGKNAGFFTRVGNDPFGNEIISVLKGEGVNTDEIKIDSRYATGIYFKEQRNSELMNVYYYRNNSAASKMSINDLNVDYMKKAKWLHVTGITPLLSDTCKELVLKSIKVAKENDIKISFDPNIRFKIIKDVEEARQLFLHIASQSDLILPGIAEGKFMIGEENPHVIADKLLSLGAKNIVIKLGDKGAYYKNDKEEDFVEGHKVNYVVDGVGAGDGFASGVLFGLLENQSLKKAVEIGNRIGSLMVMCEGDIEGLPSLEEIQKISKLENNDDILR